MSRIDNYVDREIGRQMLLEANAKEAEHINSGKLSASKLGDPLQWQVLGALGVLKDPLDEYIVRKFARGHHIEAWVLQYYTCDTVQEKVEYRGVVGRIDAMADTHDWDFPHGIMPVEVKSTSNAKFKRIVSNGPDRGHILQATLYGLAKASDWVAISYVASDDYRVQTFIIEVKEFKKEVDTIITEFDKAMKSKVVPSFVPREKWQENSLYNKYTNWMTKTDKELKALSKELFKKYDK